MNVRDQADIFLVSSCLLLRGILSCLYGFRIFRNQLHIYPFHVT